MPPAPRSPRSRPPARRPLIVVAGASVVVANANVGGWFGHGDVAERSRPVPGSRWSTPSTRAPPSATSRHRSSTSSPTSRPRSRSPTSLATVLGGVATVAPMPETPPTTDGSRQRRRRAVDARQRQGRQDAGRARARTPPAVRWWSPIRRSPVRPRPPPPADPASRLEVCQHVGGDLLDAPQRLA